jgi:hypothetical protein
MSAGDTATVCLLLAESRGDFLAVGETGTAKSVETAAETLRVLAAKGDTEAGSSNGGTVDSSLA